MTALRKNFYEQSNTRFRTLENPPARLPLPSSMKETLGFSDPDVLLQKLEKQLRVHRLHLTDLERISIAYPHKHPDAETNDKARGEADILRGELKRACGYLKFPLATAIYETVHLGRSEDQSSLHALTGRQVYAVAPELQNERLPFIEHGHDGPEFFILVDWTMAQGTTLANLASYLSHNGADIIGAVIPDGPGHPIEQRASCDRKELGDIFHAAAAGLCTPYAARQCLSLMDEALRLQGRSLDTLTHNEFNKLRNSVEFNPTNFFAILDAAGMDAPARRAFLAQNSAPQKGGMNP